MLYHSVPSPTVPGLGRSTISGWDKEGFETVLIECSVAGATEQLGSFGHPYSHVV